MPQYFFRLRTHDAIDGPDHGRDFPNLSMALAEAQCAARRIIRRSRLDLHGSLDIEDEGHRPVARILLADVARQLS